MIKIETVVTRELEMRFFRFGTGDRTMVIIPGLSLKSVMDSADMIAAAYKDFSADYTVYVFDRRSDLPEKYTVTDMANDTAAAMKSLGIKNAYVFGTSQGGMIAQLIAAGYPELVSCLVLGSTAARLSDSVRNGIAKWHEYAVKGDVMELVTEFSRAVYSEDFFNKFRDAFPMLAETVNEDDMHRFVVLSQSLEDFDIYDEIGSIKCPVLVIGAGNDRVLGAGASGEIAERLGCELYIYPEGSHAAYDEEPDYKGRILEFFGKN